MTAAASIPMEDHVADTAAPAPVVAARNLAVAYGPRTILRDFTLDVRPLRITALVGPSGCGKTSFLHCLNRLTDMIPRCRVIGSLTVGGQDILAPGLDLIAHRRRVGMIFQKPNPFPLSITQNIELALREHGVRSRADRADIVESSLRRVGLFDEVKDRLRHSALALSGGQQQRLCIARALALNPQILLMDEPCSALDPMSSAVVEDLIAELRRSISVVIVTHNLAQARRIADDMAVLWTRDQVGTLIESGPARQLFDNPAEPTTAAYLSGSRG